MDRDEYVLFIDETGTASPKDIHSQFYILAGCVVLESERAKIKNVADHIKYKYWNNTDIIFHSREIGRKENIFSVLGRNKVFTSFLTDIEEFLTARSFYIFSVVVDKSKATKIGWNDIKIYKETSNIMLRNFLSFLMCQGARGKIVIESATTQKDFYFHTSLGGLLAGGLPLSGITHTNVKDTLTSISFVTKNNFDIEEQIADLFAYAAKCHYMKNQGLKVHIGRYEEMLLRVLKKKMITPSKIKHVTKPKYLKSLKSFVVIP